MSNGLSVTNNASLPATEGQGRRTDESQLHIRRTISSDRRNRNLPDADSKTASYTLAMGYDNMHRITLKSQRIDSKIGDFVSYGSDPRRIQYAGSEADAMRTMTENIRHIRRLFSDQ